MPIRVSNVTSQILFNPSDIFVTVPQTLDLIEEPFARKLRISNVTVQILQLESGTSAFASNTLSFNELVIVLNSAGDRQPVEDVIAFQQVANVPSHPFLEDVLAFTQNARSSIHNKSIAHNLFLHDAAQYCFGAPWAAIELSDTITFIHVAGKVEIASASSTISFVDTAESVTAPIGDGHFVDFVQSVSAGIGYELSDTLVFTDEIQSFSDFLRVITDADVVEHALTYYIDNGCNRKQYARFVGEGTATPIEEQRLVFDSSLVLESIESGTVLILRSPETDDGDRLGFNRINRETRGGELNVFGDPNWAEVNTLLFTITALPDGNGACPDTLGQTLQFLQDNLGQEIFLHDWTGTSWRGVITTPDEAATEDADGYWTVTFEFEGVAEGGSVPNSVMAITDQLSFNADWVRSLSDTLAFTEDITAGGDRYFTLSDTIAFSDSISGTLEHDIMEDILSSGAAVDLEGTSPNTGSGTWRAHEEYQDDGTMVDPIDAGAYYQFTPVNGTVYELTFTSAFVTSYSDGDNCIWGFYEDQSTSSTAVGSGAEGTLDPTTAKVVHLMRETDGGTRNNAYRRGTDSDGTADTVAWTDGTLNGSPDAVLDLRITLDTTGGTNDWTARWEAKSVISPTYTEVGPETQLLSENIGAVGWSNDTINTECSLDQILLRELRPVS